MLEGNIIVIIVTIVFLLQLLLLEPLLRLPSTISISIFVSCLCLRCFVRSSVQPVLQYCSLLFVCVVRPRLLSGYRCSSHHCLSFVVVRPLSVRSIATTIWPHGKEGEDSEKSMEGWKEGRRKNNEKKKKETSNKSIPKKVRLIMEFQNFEWQYQKFPKHEGRS